MENHFFNKRKRQKLLKHQSPLTKIIGVPTKHYFSWGVYEKLLFSFCSVCEHDIWSCIVTRCMSTAAAAGMQAALLIREKQRLRRKKFRKGRTELPSHVATREIGPFPQYPPGFVVSIMLHYHIIFLIPIFIFNIYIYYYMGRICVTEQVKLIGQCLSIV